MTFLSNTILNFVLGVSNLLLFYLAITPETVNIIAGLVGIFFSIITGFHKVYKLSYEIAMLFWGNTSEKERIRKKWLNESDKSEKKR